MESILEEDENQAKDNNMMPGLGRLKTYDVTATISAMELASEVCTDSWREEPEEPNRERSPA